MPRSAKIVVTDRAISPESDDLVLHPPVLALGIGCERWCPAEEIAALAQDTLAEAGLAAGALAAIVSIELKAGEPGIHALAGPLGVPARFFAASRLLAETPRLTRRSEAAFRATGCWGVAEGAALAAAGPGGELVVPRRQSRHATCAVARAATPIDAMAIGRARGRLAIVGIGPGDPAWRTPEASILIERADDVSATGSISTCSAARSRASAAMTARSGRRWSAPGSRSILPPREARWRWCRRVTPGFTASLPWYSS
jgi:cobalt-precorrin 5A hydrolase/precorrin-3B C17-methyltransferase